MTPMAPRVSHRATVHKWAPGDNRITVCGKSVDHRRAVFTDEHVTCEGCRAIALHFAGDAQPLPLATATAVISALHSRAHAYAAEVMKVIGEHRYHGVDPGTMTAMLEAFEPDVARAFVVGFAAGVESADGAHKRERTSYPPKVPRVRRLRR